MKIKMTRTEKGSIDGIIVQSYVNGMEYDLSETDGERKLAAAFVNARMAVEMPPDPVDQVQSTPASAGFFSPEEKAIDAAPENKMIDSAPSNKHQRKAKNK